MTVSYHAPGDATKAYSRVFQLSEINEAEVRNFCICAALSAKFGGGLQLSTLHAPRVQPDAVCEVGGSTPDLSYGDLGIFLGGGQTENICTLAEKPHTLGTSLPISLRWLECSHKEMWDLK